VSGIGAIRSRTDVLLIVGLAFVALLTYPIGFMLEHPFFVDEAWVAVGTRAPLGDLAAVSFPAPTGWALTLRLPWPGEQGMRLVPLGFSVATVVMAYVFGRDLGWATATRARLIGGLAALAVMLSPWALVRQELKQYTADAFFGLLLLWLTSRVGERPTSRRIAVLVITSLVSAVISWTSMFVSAAAFLALAIVSLMRRDRTRLLWLVSAGALVAGVFALVLVTLILPYSWSGLVAYWNEYYLTGGLLEIADHMLYRYRRAAVVYPVPLPAVAVVAFLAGLVAVHRRRPATAVAVPLLICIMVGLSMAGRYPFLDQRTSHFLLMIGVVFCAVGIGAALIRIGERSRSWAGVATVVVVTALLLVAWPYLREPAIFDEDVRSQVEHVLANRVPGDVVMVNHGGHFGQAYYWEGGSLEFVFPDDDQFQVLVVGDGPILMTYPGIPETLDQALEIAGSAGSTGRVWVIRSHMAIGEPEGWDLAFAAVGVVPEVVSVGSEPLLVFDVPAG
jgi:hypothetical protein